MRGSASDGQFGVRTISTCPSWPLTVSSLRSRQHGDDAACKHDSSPTTGVEAEALHSLRSGDVSRCAVSSHVCRFEIATSQLGVLRACSLSQECSLLTKECISDSILCENPPLVSSYPRVTDSRYRLLLTPKRNWV